VLAGCGKIEMQTGKRGTRLRVLIVAAFVLATSSVLYLTRSDHCVLYYYGASPEEVPQGTAMAVLNPLRNRKDEANAERLIKDLRSEKCEKISLERLSADPNRICPMMRGNSRASLIWLDPESDITRGGRRKLIYDLPDKRARLIVYFAADEAGWGVTTASIVR
jgi:hypothetical protein